jgi:hypothetical protein
VPPLKYSTVRWRPLSAIWKMCKLGKFGDDNIINQPMEMGRIRQQEEDNHY